MVIDPMNFNIAIFERQQNLQNIIYRDNDVVTTLPFSRVIFIPSGGKRRA